MLLGERGQRVARRTSPDRQVDVDRDFGEGRARIGTRSRRPRTRIWPTCTPTRPRMPWAPGGGRGTAPQPLRAAVWEVKIVVLGASGLSGHTLELVDQSSPDGSVGGSVLVQWLVRRIDPPTAANQPGPAQGGTAPGLDRPWSAGGQTEPGGEPRASQANQGQTTSSLFWELFPHRLGALACQRC